MEDDNGQRARGLTRKSLLSGLFTGFLFGVFLVIINNMTMNIAHIFWNIFLKFFLDHRMNIYQKQYNFSKWLYHSTLSPAIVRTLATLHPCQY